jgi:hypothetical protein
MPGPSLNLLEQVAEFLPRERAGEVPAGVRGLYVLYDQPDGTNHYNAVYVGRAAGGIQGRLRSHGRKLLKGERWTHFSVYRVPDKVVDDVIIELEGLLRHIFRKDASALQFNDQGTALEGICGLRRAGGRRPCRACPPPRTLLGSVGRAGRAAQEH